MPGSAVPRPIGVGRPMFEPEYAFEYFAEPDVLYLAEDGVVARCDPRAGRARIALRESDGRAGFIGSHVFLSLSLIEMLRRRGRFAIHAAGVALNGRVALLAGAAGSGKSTLALACIRAGFAFLGDDLLFLRPEPRPLLVEAFPDEIDVADSTLRFFPDLEAIVANAPLPDGWPKRALQLERYGSVVIEWEAEPAALVFPTVAERTLLEPLSPDAALLLLVPNVLRTEPAASQRHLDALAVLARSVPAYRLDVGDPLAAPAIIRGLLGGGP